MLNLQQPHRRWNPLKREWILVSPHRTQRPWQGQVETMPEPTRISYDPQCYLCPGNERAGGVRNPPYETTFLFENDFAALLPNVPEGQLDKQGLLVAESERGYCRVLCFHPNHSLTVSKMTVSQIRPVIEEWVKQYDELTAIDEIRAVQIFENRGEMMGASNPHPHCQIWANQRLPNEHALEADAFREHRGDCLLCEYRELELAENVRTVCRNEHFVALVPFWAIWPFEIMVLSVRHVGSTGELTGEERDALAAIMKSVTSRYDNLFSVSFPYTMGFHQKPADGEDHDKFHFHAHYFPPLLRSATVRKFMVGYEMLATPQRDITAESAAERLRATPESTAPQPEEGVML